MSRRNMKMADKLAPVMRKQQKYIAQLNHSLTDIAQDSFHAAEIMKNVSTVIDEIEYDFEQSTQLRKKDVAFLFLATGLQCLRQYVIPSDAFRMTSQEGDRLMSKTVPKDWREVLCASVPYDAIRVDTDFGEMLSSGTGLGGTTHRVLTLGHDPMFGWIFGTANIMSDSLTKTDFITTYHVDNMTINGPYHGGTIGMLHDCIESVQSDKILLPVAVLRQAIHYGSDFFTKQGLPIPVLSSINNTFALTLANKFNIDTYGTLRAAGLSILINLIISYIHTLLYDKNVDGTDSAYEVRTRKVVMYSNVIASSSNIVYTAINAFLGNAPALKKFDFGGLLVTIYRLLTDRKRIAEIKKEFLENEFYKKVNG